MFFVAVVFIALATSALPVFAHRIKRIFGLPLHPQKLVWLPLVAGLAFVVSTLLSDVHISNQTATFQQHFLGVGVYSVLLFIYFKNLLRLRLNLLAEILILTIWVVTLSALVELAEFALTKLSLSTIDSSDTKWDLVANLLGAITCFAIYLTVQRSRHGKG